MTKRYRIFIADDHALIVNSVQWLLEATDDLEVISSANNGTSALRQCLHLQPDLLILDLMMPGTSSVEIIKQLRRDVSRTKILVMSAFHDPTYIKVLQTLNIHGYILKEEASDLLLSAIRSVLRDAMWFSQSVLQIMAAPLPPTEGQTLWKTLTAVEQRVLLGIGQGLSNKQIAAHLYLAEQTVRNYSSQLYQRLGIQSRTEAVVWMRTHRIPYTAGTITHP